MSDLLPRVVIGALGFIYILAGVMKLFPFTKDLEQGFGKEFVEFAKVFPLVPLGVQPDAKIYQLSVGVVELLLGVGFLFGPRPVKKVCCGGLMFVMVGSIQSLLCLNRYVDALVPTTCLAGLGYSMYSIKNNESKKKKI